jgi:hypothetical protein
VIPRRFHHYDQWEDYRSGMYARLTTQEGQIAAHAILADPDRCETTMRSVVRRWPIAAEHNLTDRTQNRRAWLGAACCAAATGCTEIDVRIAWAALSQERQDRANAVAERVIADYEAMLRGELSLLDLIPSLEPWLGEAV